MKGIRRIEVQEAYVTTSSTFEGILLELRVGDTSTDYTLGVIMSVDETLEVALALLQLCPAGSLSHKTIDRMLNTLKGNQSKQPVADSEVAEDMPLKKGYPLSLEQTKEFNNIWRRFNCGLMDSGEFNIAKKILISKVVESWGGDPSKEYEIDDSIIVVVFKEKEA